ncbi:MAG TPA: hypothetical protein ENN77_00235, partial [Candidatus Wirthbacteria bacterium]|nr:hypothetical protein [Candidatus Wirthbacteria bacterium]
MPNSSSKPTIEQIKICLGGLCYLSTAISIFAAYRLIVHKTYQINLLFVVIVLILTAFSLGAWLWPRMGKILAWPMLVLLFTMSFYLTLYGSRSHFSTIVVA